VCDAGQQKWQLNSFLVWKSDLRPIWFSFNLSRKGKKRRCPWPPILSLWINFLFYCSILSSWSPAVPKDILRSIWNAQSNTYLWQCFVASQDDRRANNDNNNVKFARNSGLFQKWPKNSTKTKNCFNDPFYARKGAWAYESKNLRCLGVHWFQVPWQCYWKIKIYLFVSKYWYQQHRSRVCSKAEGMKVDTGFDDKLDRRRSSHSHYTRQR